MHIFIQQIMESIFLGKGNLGKFGGEGLPLEDFSESLKGIAQKEKGPAVYVFHEFLKENKDKILEILGCTESEYIKESDESGILICAKGVKNFGARKIDLPTNEPKRLKEEGFERKGVLVEFLVGEISFALGTLLANPYNGDGRDKLFSDGSSIRSDQREIVVEALQETEAQNRILYRDANPLGTLYKAVLKSLRKQDPYSREYENMLQYLEKKGFTCPLDLDLLPPTYKKGRISFHEMNLFLAGEIAELKRNGILHKDSVFSEVGDRPVLEYLRLFLEEKAPTLPN